MRDTQNARTKAQRERSLELKEVGWLEGELPRIAAAAFRWLDSRLDEATAEARAQGLMVPLEASIDLLSPIGRILDERSYSQALAYLLSPSEPHALGQGPLRAILQHIASKSASAAPAIESVLPFLAQALTEPERELVSELDGQRGRTDIWIEVPASAPQLMVVMEVKVGHIITPGQLERYEAACQRRAHELRLPPDAVVKVLLTIEGEHEAPGWTSVEWQDVAALLSFLAGSPGDGAAFLRLYLAAILRNFYGLSSAPKSRAAKAILLSYLRRARIISPPSPITTPHE
ncbi:hypothetical protein COCOR_04415 [Corallococcus coralloides DSM 2259]|uniref:PD-(D/E)XK nuclease family protein n=2 Tax=Corallococcus coralloides TaxID=184914 RepID=H8MF96_CORCM|nr:hypothetical protein COCOR_04415 [Corallococcus coralloides DSM 2259]